MTLSPPARGTPDPTPDPAPGSSPPSSPGSSPPSSPGAGGPEHPARRLGRIAGGLALGFLLLPALFELMALAGEVTPFKYQGF